MTIDVYIENIYLLDYKSMREWCYSELGQSAWYIDQLNNPDLETFRWFAESKSAYTKHYGKALFTFKDEEDAVVFRLKFGV